MGDSSDNIPGCPGIGEKGALALIRRWGIVERVSRTSTRSRQPRATLAEHRAEVELSRSSWRSAPTSSCRTSVERLVRRPRAARAGRALPAARVHVAAGRAGEAPAPGSRPVTPHRGRRAGRGAGGPGRGSGRRRRLGRRGAGARAPARCWCGAATPRVGRGVLAPRIGRIWCHDAKALLGALARCRGEVGGVPRDTMLAGYLLAPGEGVELAALARRLGVAPPGRRRGGGDARVRSPSWRRCWTPRWTEEVSTRSSRTSRCPSCRCSRRWSAPASGWSRRCWRTSPGAWRRSLAELERDIHAEAGGPFNINSPLQLAEVLFARRGLPVLRRTAKTKAPSTDADVLQELAARGLRLPALILEYREQAKLKSTYVDALPRQVAADGRIHTRFNQAVAATGRLSSSDPEPAEHPGAHGARPSGARRVRGRARAPAGGRRLLADRAAGAGAPGRRADPAGRLRGRRGHPRAPPPRSSSGSPPSWSAPSSGAPPRPSTSASSTAWAPTPWAATSGSRRGEAQRFIDTYFARLPRVREYLEGIKVQARATGQVSTLFGRIRRIDGLTPPTPNCAATPSARPSTRRSRAPPPTSSSWP